jgi:hypothetical protein
MKDAMILLFHLLAVIARLLRPGGGRTIVAVCLNCLWQLELAIRHGQALTHWETPPYHGARQQRSFAGLCMNDSKVPTTDT